jgi:hypothetical protein
MRTPKYEALVAEFATLRTLPEVMDCLRQLNQIVMRPFSTGLSSESEVLVLRAQIAGARLVMTMLNVTGELGPSAPDLGT